MSRAHARGPDAYAPVLAELQELGATKAAKLRVADLVLLKLAVTGFGVRLRPVAS